MKMGSETCETIPGMGENKIVPPCQFKGGFDLERMTVLEQRVKLLAK
jgi:hypothetical protein